MKNFHFLGSFGDKFTMCLPAIPRNASIDIGLFQEDVKVPADSALSDALAPSTESVCVPLDAVVHSFQPALVLLPACQSKVGDPGMLSSAKHTVPGVFSSLTIAFLAFICLLFKILKAANEKIV